MWPRIQSSERLSASSLHRYPEPHALRKTHFKFLGKTRCHTTSFIALQAACQTEPGANSLYSLFELMEYSRYHGKRKSRHGGQRSCRRCPLHIGGVQLQLVPQRPRDVYEHAVSAQGGKDHFPKLLYVHRVVLGAPDGEGAVGDAVLEACQGGPRIGGHSRPHGERDWLLNAVSLEDFFHCAHLRYDDNIKMDARPKTSVLRNVTKSKAVARTLTWSSEYEPLKMSPPYLVVQPTDSVLFGN